jgi:hypothetical protein
MSGGDIFLIVAIGALLLFAGVLGLATWEEGQMRKKR